MLLLPLQIIGSIFYNRDETILLLGRLREGVLRALESIALLVFEPVVSKVCKTIKFVWYVE
jgi:hypothetical protein